MLIENIEKVKNVLDEVGIVNVQDEDLIKFSEVYDIVTIGNDILRNKNEDVVLSDDIIVFTVNMVNSLYHWDGCGIAAPQVGRNINMFAVKVISLDENDEQYEELPLTIFINPKIVEYSEDTSWDYEGCLSVPGYDAKVERSNSIVIEYMDIAGDMHKEKYEGFCARAIQHEYDHLKGIIYTDKADMLSFTTRENLVQKIENANSEE